MICPLFRCTKCHNTLQICRFCASVKWISSSERFQYTSNHTGYSPDAVRDFFSHLYYSHKIRSNHLSTSAEDYYFAGYSPYDNRARINHSFSDFVWDNPHTLFVKTEYYDNYKNAIIISDDLFPQMIKFMVSGDNYCMHCEEYYDAFPTFDIFALHINSCTKSAEDIIHEKISKEITVQT